MVLKKPTQNGGSFFQCSTIMPNPFRSSNGIFECLQYILNPKNCGLLGGVFFGETKFVLSNFLSNEDLSSSYES